jgi:hypothetical protein
VRKDRVGVGFKMILVIFGAGASYDSCPTFPVKGLNRQGVRNQTPERPPLAADLFYNTPIFSNALDQYLECYPIVPYLRGIPDGSSFEQVLDKLHEESKTDSMRMKQLTGVRFYLQQMLYQCEAQWRGRTRGVTNYLTLVDQLRRVSTVSGPVVIITFNYDRLLDQALSHFGINITNINDYISNEGMKLFKLHGSINWGRKLNSLTFQDIGTRNINEIAHEIIDKSPDLNLTGDYVFEDGPFPFARSNDVPVYPALAIPVIDKQTFECPDEHVDKLRQLLKNSKKVSIVAWRAAEKHFLDLIKSNVTGELTVEAVCGSQEYSQATLTALAEHGIKFNGRAFDGGFTEYVRSREAERFFSLVE